MIIPITDIRTLLREDRHTRYGCASAITAIQLITDCSKAFLYGNVDEEYEEALDSIPDINTVLDDLSRYIIENDDHALAATFSNMREGLSWCAAKLLLGEKHDDKLWTYTNEVVFRTYYLIYNIKRYVLTEDSSVTCSFDEFVIDGIMALLQDNDVISQATKEQREFIASLNIGDVPQHSLTVPNTANLHVPLLDKEFENFYVSSEYRGKDIYKAICCVLDALPKENLRREKGKLTISTWYAIVMYASLSMGLLSSVPLKMTLVNRFFREYGMPPSTWSRTLSKISKDKRQLLYPCPFPKADITTARSLLEQAIS